MLCSWAPGGALGPLVVTGNPALARLLERPLRDLRGLPLQALVHERFDGGSQTDNRAAIDRLWQAAREHRPEWTDLHWNASDGQRHTLRVELTPVDAAADGSCWQALRFSGDADTALARALARQEGRAYQLRDEQALHIARRLHDDLGQLLNAARLSVGQIHRRLGRAQPIDDELDRLDQMLATCTASTRALVQDLRAPALELGLVPALEALAQQWRRRSALPLELSLPEELAMPEPLVRVLYRIAEESLENIERHARARSASLALARVDNAAELRVADDGVGLDPGADACRSGFARMRALAEGHGGRLEVAPGDQGGTRVLARLPIKAEE